mmetsp:Transcript_20970/g.55952  ORF Transcript_20970/g.55952 Transcript_20970/m.55952 type:complete len:181 (-) Transcript_20970:14-556(-)
MALRFFTLLALFISVVGRPQPVSWEEDFQSHTAAKRSRRLRTPVHVEDRSRAPVEPVALGSKAKRATVAPQSQLHLMSTATEEQIGEFLDDAVRTLQKPENSAHMRLVQSSVKKQRTSGQDHLVREGVFVEVLKMLEDSISEHGIAVSSATSAYGELTRMVAQHPRLNMKMARLERLFLS